MSFSRPQQPGFRALVKAAWAAHCRAEGWPVAKREDRDWYEQELYAATGQTSTTECNAGRDYDRAMAHFEALAGEGIRWQMKLHGGDANRILHELQRVCGDHGITPDYLRRVARQMLRLDDLPELHLLTREHLLQVLGEVKRHVRRRKKRMAGGASDLPPAEAGENVEAPF